LLFRRTADVVPLPMWVMSADGTLLFGNDRWVQTTASTAESRAWTIAFHPEDRGRAAAALARATSRREGFSLELRLRGAHGAYQWAMCLVNPRPTQPGEIETYVGCCCDVSARRRVEAAFNRIASKLVVAQEAERSRIARELHDDLGQQVALVASRLQGALDTTKHSSRALRSSLAAARDGLGDIAVTIHNLSHELHPAKIRLLGLVQTLEALCRDIVEETGVDVRFTAEGMLSHVDEDTALCVFRVAQEALRNAVKHSGGRTFDVHLSGIDTSLTLRIADDGDGFDPLASQSAGIGLVTMRERVELMGGVLTVETAMARGTMIEIWVPVIHARADAVSERVVSARAPVRAGGRATPSASSDRDPV
jgi:PAS domain S-box-containing protein